MAGQGTVGLEIAAQVPDVDLVLVPVSGGGLLAGVASALAAIAPHVTVVGVEPERADDYRRSLAAGERLAISAEAAASTIADGLRVRTPGRNTFPVVHGLVDTIVTVTEDEILEAMEVIAAGARLIAEPSGAVTTAAWLHRDLPPHASAVAILSGGNR
jgi:threonine dehydratase